LLTSEESDVRFIAENFDWYVFPSVNPDGYQYSHTTVRIQEHGRVYECLLPRLRIVNLAPMGNLGPSLGQQQDDTIKYKFRRNKIILWQ
jgi:hypothetical protein